MKTYIRTLICLAAAAAALYPQTRGAADEPPVGIVAEGAALEKLADGFIFTEGPACDARGNVYFTDQPNDRILIWSITGELSTFMAPCGRANGLCFDAQGNLWAAADEKNELWKIDPVSKKHQVILPSKAKQKLFNAPNDLWIHPNGDIYFSDPFYKRDYWDRGPSEREEAVYYLAAGATEPKIAIGDFQKPNGLIGSPDGALLYATDIKAKQTWRYNIRPDGALADKTLFCSMGADGMTIDDQGNVYLAGKGVHVFDPKGEKIDHIPVPEKWTANVCFGGADRQTLFMTAKTGLYAIGARVKGVGSQ